MVSFFRLYSWLTYAYPNNSSPFIPFSEAARLTLKAVSGYEVAKKIRAAVHTLGPIQSFKMYHDGSDRQLSNLRSELGSSGVTLVDCPSNATKIMIGLCFEHIFVPPDF